MLYDPKWEQQTKADPYKLETLVAWLEKQPKDQQYDYQDCLGMCLLGQYMAALGIDWSHNAYMPFHDSPAFQKVAYVPWSPKTRGAYSTFGAALKRARALQAKA